MSDNANITPVAGQDSTYAPITSGLQAGCYAKISNLEQVPIALKCGGKFYVAAGVTAQSCQRPALVRALGLGSYRERSWPCASCPVPGVIHPQQIMQLARFSLCRLTASL